MQNANFSWNANTETDMLEYHVFRDIGAGFVQLVTVPVPNKSVFDATLPDGEYTVRYGVVAVDKAKNKSTMSVSDSQVVDTNPPLAPTGLVLVLL